MNPEIHIPTTDGFPPYRFRGQLVASVDDAHPDRSRWVEVRLYRTDGGQHVIFIAARSDYKDERDEIHAYPVSDYDDMSRHMAIHGVPPHLASQLFAKAGIYRDIT